MQDNGVQWILSLSLIIALLIATLASAAQASLFYINRARVRTLIAEGLPPSDAVIKTIDEPASGLSTALSLNVIGIFVGALAGTLIGFDQRLPQPAGPIVSAVLALLLLLLAEIVGRACVAAAPERTAPRLVRPLRAVGWFLSPLVLPLVWLESAMLRMIGIRAHGLMTEEEALAVTESPDGDGVLEQDERAMIHGVIGMSQRPVREVMSPRIDVAACPGDATVSDVLDQVVRTGHSRIPLYDDSVDNVIGVAYAKDLLKHLKSGALSDDVAPLTRRAYFVPESKKVDELLQEMQHQGVHIAIVVDEYGGTAGVVTIEDLLEEIVGEIRDEYDVNEEEPILRVSDAEAIVSARYSIRDLNEQFGLNLDQDEIDTVGGLIYHRLGKMPVMGDRIAVDGCELTVLETAGRRVRKVRVVRSTDHSPEQ
ncbi:MAG: hemolysin family protein [Chloroflexota bacterium]